MLFCSPIFQSSELSLFPTCRNVPFLSHLSFIFASEAFSCSFESVCADLLLFLVSALWVFYIYWRFSQFAHFRRFSGNSPTALSNIAVLKALFYVFWGLNCLLPSAWYSHFFILFMSLLLLLMTHIIRLFPAWYLFHYSSYFPGFTFSKLWSNPLLLQPFFIAMTFLSPSVFLLLLIIFLFLVFFFKGRPKRGAWSPLLVDEFDIPGIFLIYTYHCSGAPYIYLYNNK